MGTWGTAISSNDTFEDIYQEFFELYNKGQDVPEITSYIISNNTDAQADYEDKHSFWFALAKAQWECGALDINIYEKVQSIVNNGDDLKLWQELDGTSSDLKKRKKVLDEFLGKISKPNSKIKKRKKLVIRQPVFQKGDCLVFKLKNRNYGGAFVLEAENDTELGMNMLAVTTIDQSAKPTIRDFEIAYILTEKQEGSPGKYRERECITWCYVQFFKKAQTQFEVVGQLSVSKVYNSKEHCYMISQWDSIPAHVDNLNEYEKIHGKASLTVRLEEWR
jgi:hypothetical protein